MAGKGSSVPALYTELNRLGVNGEYDRALKTANKSKPNHFFRKKLKYVN